MVATSEVNAGANGENGEGSERNDCSQNMRIIWDTIKQAVSDIEPEDVVYYWISFISILIVPLSSVGLCAPYYYLVVNIRPVSESIIEGLVCSELDISEELLNESVCSMDTFETRYSLYIRQANYFHFEPSFGVSFCEHDSFAYTFLQSLNKLFGFDEIPDDTVELIGGDNIGDCTQTKLLLACIFATLTMSFALLGLLWLLLFSSRSGSTRESYIHIFFCALTMMYSGVTIALYSFAISPLRLSVDPNFCEEQTTFRDCEERVGMGVYCQFSTAILSLLVVPLYMLKWKFQSSASSNTNRKSSVEHSHHIWFFRNPHWWIKLGRISEFLLACISLMVNWTKLELLLPDEESTPVNMSSYLWGDQFCADRFFAIDEFRLMEDSEEFMDLNNFGDCKAFYKYKVVFTLIKIVVTAGSALFLKRDAARNPFFYLGGLIADVSTVVLVVIAIVVFMTQIYPGRPGIEPSFCDQYGNLRKIFLGGDEPTEDVEVCDIRLGQGFYVLCAVLPLTVVNLLIEFLAGEIGSEYGAMNAFKTVMKRVKRKEYQDALFGASSYHRRTLNGDSIEKATEGEGVEVAPSGTENKSKDSGVSGSKL